MFVYRSIECWYLMLIRCLCKKAYHIYPLCKTGINVISLSLSSLRPHPDRHASSCGLLVFWNFFRRTERIYVMPRLSSLCWFESSEPPQSGNLSQWYLNAWCRNLAIFFFVEYLGKVWELKFMLYNVVNFVYFLSPLVFWSFMFFPFLWIFGIMKSFFVHLISLMDLL